MAYLIQFTPDTCLVCSKPATTEVFNRVNSSEGKYCSKHGREKLYELHKREERLRRTT